MTDLMQDSNWLFPVIEALHLCAFALLMGSVMVFEFRILGLCFMDSPAPEMERATRPWMFLGLGLAVLSGVLLFLTESDVLLENSSFLLKMLLLVLAVATAFFRRRHVDSSKTKMVSVLSLALWISVAIAGRWIGLS